MQTFQRFDAQPRIAPVSGLSDGGCFDCRAGVDRRSVSHASQRTRYTVDFHKAPFTGLGLTFAPDPETGEVRPARAPYLSEPASRTSLLLGCVLPSWS